MNAPPDEESGGIRGLTVARVRGIPIRLHWSFLVALPFFAWVMATSYFGVDAAGWAWGAALAITLFLSVLAHELAHSLMALRLGGSVRSIVLLPIGGISMMATPPSGPRQEILITAVGPLLNLGVAAIVLGGALVAGIPLVLPRAVPDAQAFILATGYLNLTLGAFNLLVPAFPLDGGRIVRALLTPRMGMSRATQLAANIGRATALLMAFLGLFGGGLLLVAVAIFIWIGAGAEERSVLMRSTLEGVTLADIMGRAPATLSPDASLEDALRQMVASKHLALPVVDHERAVGVLKVEDVTPVPESERAWKHVDTAAHAIVTRGPDEAASLALQTILETGIIAVVDASGRLLGVVTPTDIMRTIRLLDAQGHPS